MKFCEKHRKKVVESFGHTEVENLQSRLAYLVDESSYDPWSAVFLEYDIRAGGYLFGKGIVDFPGLM